MELMKRDFGALFRVALAMLLLGLAPLAALADGAKEISLAVEAGKLVGKQKSFRVTEGDRVRLMWRADKTGEVHLHGYDLKAMIGPGKSTVMEFDAAIAGRFGVELHGAGSQHHSKLVYIEVYPK